ncbi:hypothetical protein [Paraburkholderia fungorum]|uniref:hypothetical protein n=1 Tax=Paraburkholderia fungorum TaxID=134537 RepID=UPI000D060717|nr:hypothetical protein [Paraburkholderia fungorum]PRZ48167.1 hypothetical protein BX589_128123 [Paraburkholderia fungorum]
MKNFEIYIWAWHCDVSECAYVNVAKSLKQIIKVVMSFYLPNDTLKVKKDGENLIIKLGNELHVVENNPHEVSEFLQTECHKRHRNDHFEIKFL